MPKGRSLDEYLEGYRKTVESEEVAAFEAYSASFRLANQILQARRTAGMTQVELAERSGIGQAEISRLEQGGGNPTVETLSRIGGCLDLRLDLVKTPRPAGPAGSGHD